MIILYCIATLNIWNCGCGYVCIYSNIFAEYWLLLVMAAKWRPFQVQGHGKISQCYHSCCHISPRLQVILRVLVRRQLNFRCSLWWKEALKVLQVCPLWPLLLGERHCAAWVWVQMFSCWYIPGIYNLRSASNHPGITSFWIYVFCDRNLV